MSYNAMANFNFEFDSDMDVIMTDLSEIKSDTFSVSWCNCMREGGIRNLYTDDYTEEPEKILRFVEVTYCICYVGYNDDGMIMGRHVSSYDLLKNSSCSRERILEMTKEHKNLSIIGYVHEDTIERFPSHAKPVVCLSKRETADIYVCGEHRSIFVDKIY